jgi:hypothetical protein
MKYPIVPSLRILRWLLKSANPGLGGNVRLNIQRRTICSECLRRRRWQTLEEARFRGEVVRPSSRVVLRREFARRMATISNGMANNGLLTKT